MKSCDIAHEIVKSVSCNASCGIKVDTVEFAIDSHPEIPGDVAQDNRFQAVSGLYADDDAQPAAPARKPRKSAPRRAPRKTTRSTAAAAQPQGELNSPAFDNFEGVDFDS